MRVLSPSPSLVLGAILAGLVSGTVLASGDHDGGHAGDAVRNFAFGQPAADTEPDRLITITATDKMNYTPSRVEVEPGQVIHFEVENAGTLHHSFTLGSSDWHQDHEQEMQGMSADKITNHMSDVPNGLVVPPGETRTLTWEFTRGGSVIFGCHVPGHWPAGMKGKIDLG